MDIMLGTPLYMAPELAEGKEYDCRVDVWSVGIICHILLCGEAPFTGANNSEIRNAILNNELDMCGTKWTKVSKEARSFIRKCLVKKAIDRPFVNDLFQDPFIKHWVDNPVIKAETELSVAENICSFRKDTIL